MKTLLKWPVAVSAAAVVIRVALERAGGPESISRLFSVLVITVLLAPLYFAVRLAWSGHAHPYGMALKATALHAVIARLMVLPAYWLARIYQWPDFRYESVVRAGSDFNGYVLIPLSLPVFIISIVVGCVVATVALASLRLVVRRPAAPVA